MPHAKDGENAEFSKKIAAQMERVAAAAHEIEALSAEMAPWLHGENAGAVLAEMKLAVRHLEDAESRLERAWVKS